MERRLSSHLSKARGSAPLFDQPYLVMLSGPMKVFGKNVEIHGI